MWPTPTKPGTNRMGLFWDIYIGHWNFDIWLDSHDFGVKL